MRKVLILIIMLSVFVFACTGPGKKNKREREILTFTIGINLPLTGNGSYFAEEFKKGLELTFDYLNAHGEKVFINVIYEDNKLNPKDAVTITKKFLEIDDADLILCGYTPIIQATIAIVEKQGVPMLVTLSSAENIAKDYQWAFRDFELESDNMPLIASYAYTGMGLHRGTWLVVNDDMGTDAVRFFTEQFTEEGGEMIDGEVFEASEMDLRNKINKIMDHDPEFIIVVGRGSAMINACRQIRERNESIPILSNNTVDNQMVWEALGTLGEHIWFPRPYTDLSSQLYQKANERFRTKYNADMNWLNIYGMSIANYLARGLQRTGGDREAMREYLRTLDVFSLRGRLIMNENSDVSVPHVVYKRMDGKSVPAEEYMPDHSIE